MSKVKLIGDIVENDGVRVAWLLPNNVCKEVDEFREYITDRDMASDNTAGEEWGQVIVGLKTELDMLGYTLDGMKGLKKDDYVKLSTRINILKGFLE